MKTVHYFLILLTVCVLHRKFFGKQQPVHYEFPSKMREIKLKTDHMTERGLFDLKISSPFHYLFAVKHYFSLSVDILCK